MRNLYVIMPVKDSMETTRNAIATVMAAITPDETIQFAVYDDNSTEENAGELQRLAQQFGFALHSLANLAPGHPSPNYRTTLQHAQRYALASGSDLVIVESDVMVRPDTLHRMRRQVLAGVGMVAAVTVDEKGHINFPYEYAAKLTGDVVVETKRFSFCCTLLSLELLQAYSFEALNPEKSWYDVFISHKSVELGFVNLLMLNNPVLHKPHSSRPWKQLKYTNPLRYYLLKLLKRRDRI